MREPDVKEKFFIIDMMPFLYKGHFVFLRNPRMTSSGFNTSALLGFANALQGILLREKPALAAIAADPGGPTFRHEAYPPYKAQRQKMPEDLAASIRPAGELAAALGLPVFRADGFEADDVMGTLAAKGAAAGFDVFLATPDKDAAQLVRPGVRLYRPGSGGSEPEIYDEAAVCRRWGLESPGRMVDWLAMAGDASDNIPGIRGVGEKTASALLAQYGSLESVLEAAPSLKGALAKKVSASRDDALMSKFLATIRTDAPVECDWEACRTGRTDSDALAAFCSKYELSRFAAAMLGDGRATAPDAAVRAGDAGDGGGKAPATLADWPHDYRLVDTEDAALSLVEELSRSAGAIAFDTETAAHDGFPPTDAHHCRLVGFSLASAPGKAWYVTGDLVDLFRPLFADPAKTFVGHNVKFDISVLLRHGIGFARPPRDTMLERYCLDAAARHSLDAAAERFLSYRPIPIESLVGERARGREQLSMAALKPEQILDYAAEDADVALRLDAALRPEVEKNGALGALERAEEPLVKILVDMEREGARIDIDALKEQSREIDREILALVTRIRDVAGPGFNPDSPRQLSVLLFDRLGLPIAGVKKTATGGYSTDEKTLTKLEGAHPVVRDIMEYRACTKLKSTYIDKLPALIDANGRIHTTWSQAFTETGRLSSADPNLQNIPVRTERGRRIRKAFVARDPDHAIVSADYSQIELRLMAAFSRDEAMLAAFRNGEDIHRETASRVYGVMPGLVTPEQRSKCKMVNFGIIYGISAFGLSQRLKVPRKEAAGLIESYFRLYPGVKAYMEKAVADAREKGYAETVLGRRRTLRDINSANATARQAAERDAVNTPIQGSAADLVKVAMVNISKAFSAAALRAKMILQIHDELVFDVPLAEVDAVKEIVRREMVSAIDFGVPLEVGIASGPTWLDAH